MNLYRLTVYIKNKVKVNVTPTDAGQEVEEEEILFDNLLTLPVRQALDLNQKEIFGKLKKTYPNLSSIILEEFP